MNLPPAQAYAVAPPGTGWWRRNRLWLAGAVVLGLLAWWLPWRSEWNEYGRRGFSRPVEAASSGWSEYEGSRWRLVEVLRDDGVSNIAGGYLHPDASLLVVVYEVIPGRDATVERLDRCKGQLADAGGRVWGAGGWGELPLGVGVGLSQATLTRARRALDLGTGCGSRPTLDPVPVKARPTRPFRFFHPFLVPRALPSEGLHAGIVLDPFETRPPGSFIRFRLGASRPLPAAAPARN